MFEEQSWTLFQQNIRELWMCWRFEVHVAVETEQIKLKVYIALNDSFY